MTASKRCPKRATTKTCRGAPRLLLLATVVLLSFCPTSLAQVPDLSLSDESEPHEAPARSVEIRPSASDDAIARRIERILKSTGWYDEVGVQVDEGVVFLEGTARSGVRREWAEDLALQTESVVAVVNRLEVHKNSPWSLDIWRAEVERTAERAQQVAPTLLFAALVVLITWALARGIARVVKALFRRRVPSVLLLDLMARVAGLLICVLGFYVVLRVLGLTRLAMTLLGGTGVAALVLGIAFRDIIENFLASVLISLRRPFSVGDVVGIQSHVGVVQKVSTRGTVLMSFDGNHVQIPNATVYKSEIINFTANPKRRMDFALGIGYEDALTSAQQLSLRALQNHPAVLEDPEPLVLVEELGSATVNLRLYFWYDGTRHDGLKIRSALIRNVKHELEEAGVSMPDEAREVIFPKGVPIISSTDADSVRASQTKRDGAASRESGEDASAVDAEGGLASEQQDIQAQAASARSPEEGVDLLETDTLREV